MKNIAIFASGSGTNAENLVHFFRTSPFGQVSLVLTNRPDAGVIQRAQSNDIECIVFNRRQFYNTNEVVDLLVERGIEFVILAGFLWLVPDNLLKLYDNKVVNIHPALLPKYGGKGMYGMHVHRAVVANKEAETGITIHYVNERYDEGTIIFQKKVALKGNDTPEDVAAKIHVLEQENFPKVIEKVLKKIDEG